MRSACPAGMCARKALNEAFGGRGGGKPGFCQGSLACTDFADVQNFLVNYHE